MEVIHSPLKLVVSALTEEQVKAGVAYVASSACHIGRQSRPFRRSLGFSLGGLLKGRPDLEVFQEIKQFPYFSQRKSCPVLLGVIKKKRPEGRRFLWIYQHLYSLIIHSSPCTS